MVSSAFLSWPKIQSNTWINIEHSKYSTNPNNKITYTILSHCTKDPITTDEFALKRTGTFQPRKAGVRPDRNPTATTRTPSFATCPLMGFCVKAEFRRGISGRRIRGDLMLVLVRSESVPGWSGRSVSSGMLCEFVETTNYPACCWIDCYLNSQRRYKYLLNTELLYYGLVAQYLLVPV